MAINEGVAPYPSCLCPGFFARASTKGTDFTWMCSNNDNNNINNDDKNNNRSRDSADLLGIYVIKLF